MKVILERCSKVYIEIDIDPKDIPNFSLQEFENQHWADHDDNDFSYTMTDSKTGDWLVDFN